MDDIVNETLNDSFNSTSVHISSVNLTNDLMSTAVLLLNETSNGTVTAEPDYQMQWWQTLIWTFFFGLMVIIATGGNLIVIWIVLSSKRMRTVTNYFIVNLSVADTMVSTLNVIFSGFQMLSGEWPFGSVYCKISNFVAILSVAASVFTLMAISIDRYTAIIHPLKPRMSRKMALNITFTIWLFSFLLSSPNFIYSVTLPSPGPNNNTIYLCYNVWPDDVPFKSLYEYVYNLILFVVTYTIPISSMFVTYYRVGVELWGSQSIGECTAKQMSSIKSKRKIVKMMIFVFLIFAICWLPYHIYFILLYHFPNIARLPYTQHIYLFIYWLAMSNSMYNPFIYCWMNSRFRQGFRKVFCCICLRKEETQKRYEEIYNTKRNRKMSYSEAYTTDTPNHRLKCSGNGTLSVPMTAELIDGTPSSSLVFSPKPARILKSEML